MNTSVLLNRPVVVVADDGVYVGVLRAAGDFESGLVVLGNAYRFGAGEMPHPEIDKLALTGEMPPGRNNWYGPFPAVRLRDAVLVLGFHERSGAYERFLLNLGNEGEDTNPDAGGR